MAIENTQKPTMKYWCDQINAYEREVQNWESDSKKIVKVYKGGRTDAAKRAAKFNILWSNVQTLHPALYDGAPTPNVDRRFEDDEEVKKSY